MDTMGFEVKRTALEKILDHTSFARDVERGKSDRPWV